jgi:hypothetical protein
LNNWAKLWTLLLLTVLVISFAQTIHKGSIRVDITDVPYLIGNFH